MLEPLISNVLAQANTALIKLPQMLARTPQNGAGGGGGGGIPAGPDGNPGGGGSGTTNSPSSLLPMLLFGFLIFMVLTMVLSGRKEKKARAELLSSLAKHDRVQTAGGMIGTIVEIKGDEVVLKVDETTNTKVRFTRGSVTAILKKGRGGEQVTEPETIDSVN